MRRATVRQMPRRVSGKKPSRVVGCFCSSDNIRRGAAGSRFRPAAPDIPDRPGDSSLYRPSGASAGPVPASGTGLRRGARSFNRRLRQFPLRKQFCGAVPQDRAPTPLPHGRIAREESVTPRPATVVLAIGSCGTGAGKRPNAAFRRPSLPQLCLFLFAQAAARVTFFTSRIGGTGPCGGGPVTAGQGARIGIFRCGLGPEFVLSGSVFMLTFVGLRPDPEPRPSISDPRHLAIRCMSGEGMRPSGQRTDHAGS